VQTIYYYYTLRLFHSVFPQGASSGGVKRTKVESWERSVGTLGGKGTLGSLVVRKRSGVAVNKSAPEEATAGPTSQTGNTSAFKHEVNQ